MFIPFTFPLTSRDIFVSFCTVILLCLIMIFFTKDDKSGAGARHLAFGVLITAIFATIVLFAIGRA